MHARYLYTLAAHLSVLEYCTALIGQPSRMSLSSLRILKLSGVGRWNSARAPGEL